MNVLRKIKPSFFFLMFFKPGAGLQYFNLNNVHVNEHVFIISFFFNISSQGK